jgi:hypothetical protein
LSSGVDVTDGPEEIMEADEYLQPQITHHMDPRHMNGKVSSVIQLLSQNLCKENIQLIKSKISS